MATRLQRILQLRDRLDTIHEALDTLADSPDAAVTFEGRNITLVDRERLEAWMRQTRGELNLLANHNLGCGRFGTLEIDAQQSGFAFPYYHPLLTRGGS